MFNLFGMEWPFLVAALFMTVAGVLQVTRDRVPNSLTFATFFAAFPACLASPNPASSLGAVFVCAFCGFALLILPYSIASLGAGCVKAQTAFGAWIGLGMSLRSETGATMMTYSTLSGVVLTLFCIAVFYKIVQVKRSQQPAFTFEPNESDERINYPLFPAQLTLSLGSLVFMIFALTNQ